tara:strand:+ start:155 stop:418 length:264 start_codon:yes stop_codon:yes gene_type:complete
MTEEKKQPEVDESKEMVIVSSQINAMMERFAKRNINPDMIAYMMMSAGTTLLLANNRFNPLFYGEVIAAALTSANQAVAEDDEETKH